MGAAWLRETLRRLPVHWHSFSLSTVLAYSCQQLFILTHSGFIPPPYHLLLYPPTPLPSLPFQESSADSPHSWLQLSGWPHSPRMLVCFFCFSHRSLTPSHHRNLLCLVAKSPIEHSLRQTPFCGLAWHCDCYFC